MRRLLQAVFVLGLLASTMSTALAQKSRWVQTHSWSGHGTCDTPKFLANGKKWRVRYLPTGRGAFNINLRNEEGNTVKRISRQRGSHPLNGSRVVRGIGTYYLSVEGPPTKWQIVIEQYLTPIEEWHLLKYIRGKRVDFGKLGSWAGEEIRNEYEVVIPYESWKLVQTVAQEGNLAVRITDEQGHMVLSTLLEQPGKYVGWGHGSGTFRMEITSSCPDWQIELLGDQTDPPAVPK